METVILSQVCCHFLIIFYNSGRKYERRWIYEKEGKQLATPETVDQDPDKKTIPQRGCISIWEVQPFPLS